MGKWEVIRDASWAKLDGELVGLVWWMVDGWTNRLTRADKLRSGWLVWCGHCQQVLDWPWSMSGRKFVRHTRPDQTKLIIVSIGKGQLENTHLPGTRPIPSPELTNKGGTIGGVGGASTIRDPQTGLVLALHCPRTGELEQASRASGSLGSRCEDGKRRGNMLQITITNAKCCRNMRFE